jgi:phage I-like protein
MLDDFIKNFQENKRGIDLAVDINHEPNHKAVGWIKNLAKKGGDAVFATVEWTKEGLELVKSGAYKYFSPELFFSFRDEESGETIQNLLV